MVIDAINQSEDKGNGFMVPIGVSARHVHLTQEHVEALFGPGYQLTKKKDLMGGQFASNETVTIVGLKLRAIEKVRVLGPVPVSYTHLNHETSDRSSGNLYLCWIMEQLLRTGIGHPVQEQDDGSDPDRNITRC